MQDPLSVLLPTSNVWDPSQIYETEGIDEPLEELLVRMYQNLNQMSLAINLKDSAYYTTQEFVNNQQFFAPTGTDQTAYRDAFRVTVNFGALPSGAPPSKSVAHGIGPSSAYTATRIYAAATKPSTINWIPIPYVSATAIANNLQLDVDATNVTITTGGTDYSLYTKCIVVIEYIKE